MATVTVTAGVILTTDTTVRGITHTVTGAGIVPAGVLAGAGIPLITGITGTAAGVILIIGIPMAMAVDTTVVITVVTAIMAVTDTMAEIPMPTTRHEPDAEAYPHCQAEAPRPVRREYRRAPPVR